MQMLVQQSDARVQHLSNMLSSTLHPNSTDYSLQQDMIPVPVMKQVHSATMVLEVGIGTFENGAYKSYLQAMDTRSSKIWTQCEDCRRQHCYSQKDEYFPNSKSKSYMALNPPSTYTLIYADGSNSTGILAKETFTFPSTSSSSPHLKLPNIIFGCGTNNYHPLSVDNSYPIVGIFGLGMEETSFINQIERQSGGKFSYCFVNMVMENHPPMYLRVGTNIKPPRRSKTIKFLPSSTTHYFLDLIDLGVNRERLHINERILNSPDIGYKGIGIDSGAAISYLTKGAYDIVVKKLEDHFSKHKGEFKKERDEEWFMYSRIKGASYNNVPGITFYFEGGAQLDVNPEDTFMRIIIREGVEAFLLTIRQSPLGFNILGAFQQVNYKLIYNVKDKTLQFGQEDCAKNG
ncbi:hypothetical protein Lal_00027045 [Lupinus albus]|nr:hypothetical protein Lal_00027045 [Lupinus albus]